MGVWNWLRIRWAGAMAIQDTIENALRQCVEAETDIQVFSFSLKPSKPLADGGLGLQPNAWHGLLDRLKDSYLPQSAPYTKLLIDQTLVDKTYDKDLGTTSQKLTLLIAP